MFFDEACCTGPVGTDAVFRGVNAAFQHQDAILPGCGGGKATKVNEIDQDA